MRRIFAVVLGVAAWFGVCSAPAVATDHDQRGLVNIDDTSVQVPVQACGTEAVSHTVDGLVNDLSRSDCDVKQQ
jgi:hypothetical protein